MHSSASLLHLLRWLGQKVYLFPFRPYWQIINYKTPTLFMNLFLLMFS